MTLEIITSEALRGVRHGFFTRRGGVSSGLYGGLNCGTGSSDRADAVAVNRTRVAKAMRVSPDRLANVHQVHSAVAVHVTVPLDGPSPKADAMVTCQTGIALCVLTADCQPVLFADRRAGVVGAAHAGWKGTLNGVLEATVDAMESNGAIRTRTVAVIGPAISRSAYEVGPEFRDEFVSDTPENARFFSDGAGDRYRFDLPAYSLYRLRKAGIAHAEWTGHCTYSDAARFYSYRRSIHRREDDYGRLLSSIRL
ncbi:MAG: peptidoglycan editing factor PgeF [Rhodobacter sp.]|nr:peptidoglycan editing factor PgeF [Rhodobacter sp.]